MEKNAVDIIPAVRFSKTSGGAQEKTRLLLTRFLIRDKQCCDENHSKNIYRGLDRGDFALGVFFAGGSALDSGSRSSTSPLAISIISLASWAGSRGRLRRFSGMVRLCAKIHPVSRGSQLRQSKRAHYHNFLHCAKFKTSAAGRKVEIERLGLPFV
jgi:hypothetical protein